MLIRHPRLPTCSLTLQADHLDLSPAERHVFGPVGVNDYYSGATRVQTLFSLVFRIESPSPTTLPDATGEPLPSCASRQPPMSRRPGLGARIGGSRRSSRRRSCSRLRCPSRTGTRALRTRRPRWSPMRLCWCFGSGAIPRISVSW